MITLAYRNCLLYSRNKNAIFSSFIGAFIVILLYVFFLGNSVKQGFEGLTNIDFLLNSWILAGFISVASISTTMSAFSLLIRDKEAGVYKDLLISPLKSWQIVGGYVFSAYIWGVIMTVISAIIGECCLVWFVGGTWLTLNQGLALLGAILLMVLAATTMIFFIVSFFDKMETFSTVSTIIGTLVGFLTGCYVPLGSLPETAATVVKAFPLTHGVVLIRGIMTATPRETAFSGKENELLNQFNQLMGITLSTDTTAWINQWWGQVGILLASSILFFVATLIVFSKKQQRQ